MLTVNLQGEPTEIKLGENTSLAAFSANASASSAAEAAVSASFAEEFSGPVYASTSAGVTATTVGQFFRVAIGTTPQTYNRYERTSTSPFYKLAAPLATTTALAATGGAGLIGTSAGETVQARISALNAITGTGPLVIVIAGQSNARGANTGGPNPSNPNVFTWDAVAGGWVNGGQYTALPWTRSEPDGNTGNNNLSLGAAHELQAKTGRPVYVIMDAVGGQSITQWVPATGARYVALKAKVAAALATLSGKTTIDMLIWAQGEENSGDPVNQMDFATYLGNLTALNTQLRGETWMVKTTPVFATGMAPMYDKFAPQSAIRYYCGKVNANWTYVSMKGLDTVNSLTGSGDATHWVGDSLYAGGQRIASAWLAGDRSKEIGAPNFWGRGTGELKPGDTTAIASFDHLISWGSRDTSAPEINGHYSVGAIAWGNQCVSGGNYSFAFGATCVTGQLSNYTILVGLEHTSTDSADYGAAFGWGHTLNANNTFAAGRGHVLDVAGQAAVGIFSASATIGGNPLAFRVGVGTGTSSRANAYEVTDNGISYYKTLTVSALPAGVKAGCRAFVTDATATTFASIVAGGGSNKVPVYSDGTNWRIG